jgi:hypothetical protein
LPGISEKKWLIAIRSINHGFFTDVGSPEQESLQSLALGNIKPHATCAPFATVTYDSIGRCFNSV